MVPKKTASRPPARPLSSGLRPRSTTLAPSGRSIMDFQLLEKFGIPTLPHAFVQTLPQAIAAAQRLGYPVALKLASAAVLHKSEHNALALNLKSAATVTSEFQRLSHLSGAGKSDFILVQKYVPGRLELIVGGRIDPQFGPVLLFGMGGIYTEVLRDVSLRVCPVDSEEAHRMVRRLRSFPILAGARGQQAVDEHALVDVLLRASKLMMSSHPKELDINPLLVTKNGIFAADARVIR